MAYEEESKTISEQTQPSVEMPQTEISAQHESYPPETTAQAETAPSALPRPNIGKRVAKIVWLIATAVLELLILLRILFRLFGANPNNAIVDFIFTKSHPLVEPFMQVFKYDEELILKRFELESLSAILFYGIVAGLLYWIIFARKLNRN